MKRRPWRHILIMRIYLLIGICIFAFLPGNSGFGQSRYNLTYDPDLTMTFGAENIATAGYLWQTFDNKFIPLQIFKGDNKKAKIGNIGYRLSKLFLLDYPLTFILPSIQHERFGHGSRGSEFGATDIDVSITLPPPFQFSFPSVSSNNSNEQTPEQFLMQDIGGSEGNIILGDILRKNILLDNALDYHTAFLYLYANNDLSGYAAFAAKGSAVDIQNIVGGLNNLSNGNNYSLDQVQLYGLLSIVLDPINYYAFNSIFNGYLFNGRTSSKIHFIRLNERLHYFPKVSFNFAPYGVEFNLQNYFMRDGQLYSFTLSHNDGAFEKAWRISANGWNVIKNAQMRYSFGMEIWQQPNLSFYNGEALENAQGLGGAILSTVHYDFLNAQNKFGIMLQLLYKTKGFMKGEMLTDGLIGRGGLTLKF